MLLGKYYISFSKCGICATFYSAKLQKMNSNNEHQNKSIQVALIYLFSPKYLDKAKTRLLYMPIHLFEGSLVHYCKNSEIKLIPK